MWKRWVSQKESYYFWLWSLKLTDQSKLAPCEDRRLHKEGYGCEKESGR
jgi:hypothetical protein